MNQNDIELRTIFAVLRRQVRMIIYAFATVFTLAGLFLLAAEPKYTATGLVLVDPKQKNLLDPSQGFSPDRGNESARIDSEVEILRSSTIAMDVILSENLIADSEFGPQIPLREKLAMATGMAHASAASRDQLASKTLARFKNALTIRRKGLTHLIAVSVSSTSPAKAADIANVVARSYIDRQVQSKIATTLAARDVLQAQITDARRVLADSDAAFDTFISANIPRLQTIPGNERLAKLQQKLTQSDNGILGGIQLVQERQSLQARLAKEDITPSDQLDIKTQLADLDLKLHQQSDARLLGISTDVQKLEQERSEIRDQLRQTVLNSELPADLLAEIYAIQQEANISRTQYRNLLLRLHDLDAQSRVHVADSQLISPALPPVAASFPNRNLVLLAALAASMGIGISLAFVNEYFIGGVTSPSQLADLWQVDAIALPKVEEHFRPQATLADMVVDSPLAPYSEALRNLRASIDQSFRNGEGGVTTGKTILVTSALTGEGKTTTALSLARTYALAGKKTLLIDADLRNPSVHHHLGFQPKVGFLDYLSSPADIEIDDAFYGRDPASQLALIMGAGRSMVPTDPLLDSAAFETLLNQAREVYDVILIDSPPLSPVVDARYIAHHADAVVLVAKWAVSRQNDLRNMVAPLRTAMKKGATFLPVLTQMPEPAARTQNSESYSAAI